MEDIPSKLPPKTIEDLAGKESPVNKICPHHLLKKIPDR